LALCPDRHHSLAPTAQKGGILTVRPIDTQFAGVTFIGEITRAEKIAQTA
jgi:hypothetical protein